MSKEQWAALYESNTVREIFDYIVWLAEHDATSVPTAAIKLFRNGKSRVEQLRKYATKRQDAGAQFRPYAPLRASGTTRVEVKRRAQAEGCAPLTGQTLFGHDRIDGKRCWLPPHVATVEHRF